MRWEITHVKNEEGVQPYTIVGVELTTDDIASLVREEALTDTLADHNGNTKLQFTVYNANAKPR